jgi:hypothetical protein
MKQKIKYLLIGSLIGFLLSVFSIGSMFVFGYSRILYYISLPAIIVGSHFFSCSGDPGCALVAMLQMVFFYILVGLIIGYVVYKIKSRR